VAQVEMVDRKDSSDSLLRVPHEFGVLFAEVRRRARLLD
jgi:hypothetical protein